MVYDSFLDEYYGIGLLVVFIEFLIIDVCGICDYYENGGKIKINRMLVEDIDIIFLVIWYFDGVELLIESRFVMVIEVLGFVVI